MMTAWKVLDCKEQQRHNNKKVGSLRVKKKKKNERDFKSVPPNNENYMLSSLDLWRQSSIN